MASWVGELKIVNQFVFPFYLESETAARNIDEESII
jgi:hypothetical protein